MAANGTWLCPAEFDRARMLEMESRIANARAIMYGSLGVAFLILTPWLGGWIMIPLTASVLGYTALRPRIATSERPEYVLAATVVNAQVLIGIGIALTGGPASPAIPILLLPIVTLPARFPVQGVVAGVALTVVVLLASTVAVDPSGFADDPTYTLVGLAAVFGLAAFAQVLMRSEIEQRGHATRDPLTGLLNRKALAPRFDEIAEQAALGGGCVSVIECDLDHFKLINDAHGHSRGDLVLKGAADALRSNLRSFELVYRLGGEEFLVLLPGLALGEAVALAERVRAGIEFARPGGLAITASLGVACGKGSEIEFDALFHDADVALYLAKVEGRNRVVAYDHVAADVTAARSAAGAMARRARRD